MTKLLELIINGHRYIARYKNAPCPIPGRENCMIATEHKGLPAYWENGILYLMHDRTAVKAGERQTYAR